MSATLNACGCCAGTGVETPLALYNRPGLSAIAYRVGTYASFRHSLLARLSDGRWPVLRSLTTRDSDDFTIALLDAWAVAGDVLTFYQERIANESYLRTATERLSILEQARLLGYQLAPGLAASTYLAFTIETAPGAPAQAAQPVTIAAGAKVQSVPGPDEQPQIFETVEAIEARPEWNTLQAQLTKIQPLAWDMEELWLDGGNLNLSVGDVVLIHAEKGGGGFEGSVRRIARVQQDTGGRRTRLTLETVSSPAGTVTTDRPGAWVMRAQASPFGHNAPLKPNYNSDGVFLNTFSEWPLDSGESDTKLTLSTRNDKILNGSWVVIEQDDPDDATRKWIFANISGVTHLAVTRYGLAGSATRLSLSSPWEKNVSSTLALLRTLTVAAQSEELPIAALPLQYPVFGVELPLDVRVEGLIAGRPMAVSGNRQHVRVRENGDGSVMTLDSGGSVILQAGDVLAIAQAPLKVVGSQALTMTPEEFATALNEGSATTLRLSLIDRDGQTGTVDLAADGFELEPAGDRDDSVSEIAFIDAAPDTAITHDRDRTTVQFAGPLAFVYARATVRINANVAAATHGESVKEALGSGDATISYQSFALRQPPLTYVGADTPSGSASTLRVYVNDVLWQEAPFFCGRGANEHIYVTERDDEGRTTIRFGDGLTGARLPTGTNNVRAEYRKGTGLGGLVDAGQLSQLLSRPLGVKEVVNPEAVAGAEDPESRDDARKNAPMTVLTLDRAVSLQDYEDFARAFAGIAKAQAVWVWDGRRRSIFLTIAGPDGAVLEEDGAIIGKLKEALRAYGDPYVAFTIKGFREALFQVHGTVTVHADHLIDAVMAAVHADLLERYSFDAREFGQPVALSEVIAVIQSVTGVIAVDIDQFYRNDATTPPKQPRLIADRPAMGADGIVPAAELLLLDGASLNHLEAIQ
jgi:hypothetical protein